MGETVVVAMSGGVDSSVAAALLVEQGFEVVGVTLRLWDCGDEGGGKSCCGMDPADEARAAAGRLGIPHYVVEGRDVFREKVLGYAWSEYARGRTPNPCVPCNEWIKFGVLLDKARSLGASRVATGHFARVGGEDGARRLCRGRDGAKDQSYFLFSLDGDRLDAALFPVGGQTKEEVRALARARGLANANRPESQDACFVSADAGFAETLRRRLGGEARPGRLVDSAGRVVGEHPGIHHFTVGQRHGLGVALGRRAYVRAIRADTAEVVLETDEKALWTDGMVVAGSRAAGRGPLPEGPAEVQIRSRHAPVAARLKALPTGDLSVAFGTPQRAVTPGQAAVFYQGDRVLGGGWIETAFGESP